MLQHNWTAEVVLNNGQQITIWWTAWSMTKDSIKDVLSVSSDYPAAYSVRHFYGIKSFYNR